MALIPMNLSTAIILDQKISRGFAVIVGAVLFPKFANQLYLQLNVLQKLPLGVFYFPHQISAMFVPSE
jgi:hypothetical protein